jgi:hypothetical protein
MPITSVKNSENRQNKLIWWEIDESTERCGCFERTAIALGIIGGERLLDQRRARKARHSARFNFLIVAWKSVLRSFIFATTPYS